MQWKTTIQANKKHYSDRSPFSYCNFLCTGSRHHKHCQVNKIESTAAACKRQKLLLVTERANRSFYTTQHNLFYIQCATFSFAFMYSIWCACGLFVFINTFDDAIHSHVDKIEIFCMHNANGGCAAQHLRSLSCVDFVTKFSGCACRMGIFILDRFSFFSSSIFLFRQVVRAIFACEIYIFCT